MLTELNIKALLIGVFTYLAFVMLVSGTLTLMDNLIPSLFQSTWFHSGFWIIGMVMMSSGGFVSGFTAGRRGILHGVVVSIVGALIVVSVLSLITSGQVGGEVLKGYLTVGLVMSGMAGGIGELVKVKRGRSGL